MLVSIDCEKIIIDMHDEIKRLWEEGVEADQLTDYLIGQLTAYTNILKKESRVPEVDDSEIPF